LLLEAGKGSVRPPQWTGRDLLPVRVQSPSAIGGWIRRLEAVRVQPAPQVRGWGYRWETIRVGPPSNLFVNRESAGEEDREEYENSKHGFSLQGPGHTSGIARDRSSYG